MEAVIDDGKTKEIVYNNQENNNKLDESAKAQPNEEKPGEPEGQNKEKPYGREETLQNTEKIDGPKGQIKEKHDDREETLQSKEKLDEPEGTLQNKKRPFGKQKNRKLRFRKKKKNAGNGNVDQNQINVVKSKVAHPEELKFATPEGSSQQKQLELVRPVGDQQFKENTEEPEGTDNQGGNGENNGEVSKGDKNKKLKQRARKGKVSAGIKMEKLKQNIGEASKGKNIEKTKDIPSSHDKGRRPDKSKDKLGGLIFMCSPKTKPDCFRYSVMGVTMAKKDLVLCIKPGLKLFLYDFDLKLLYGVYRATSSGGIKLEPAAFGGAFPVQVKFEVFKDCYPLPESVFKKAIKENYNEKRKFKTELTFEQVKKLTTLFRTVGVSSKTHTRSPAVKRDEVTKARGGFKKHRTNSSRAARSERDAHAYVDDGREARKEEYPRESYLSEREYRTYGLLGRRRSRSPPRHAGSSLVPRLDLESEVHPRYPVSVYGDTTTSIRHDPLLVGRSDSRPYSLEGRRGLPSPIRHEPTMLDGRRYLTHDPISQLDYQTHLPPAVRQHSGLESNQQQYAYPRYDFSSDPYRSAIRRDEMVGGPYYTLDGRRVVYLPEAADPLRRREPEVGALDLSAPLDYNQGHTYQEASRHDPVFAPVSSRYSFAGPSSYR
ncbi:hypothetical protein QQ045_010880 [Rhodiola kirilowii]